MFPKSINSFNPWQTQSSLKWFWRETYLFFFNYTLWTGFYIIFIENVFHLNAQKCGHCTGNIDRNVLDNMQLQLLFHKHMNIVSFCFPWKVNKKAFKCYLCNQDKLQLLVTHFNNLVCPVKHLLRLWASWNKSNEISIVCSNKLNFLSLIRSWNQFYNGFKINNINRKCKFEMYLYLIYITCILHVFYV
jgi:hypothetical protein